jgi:HNH endonuclease
MSEPTERHFVAYHNVEEQGRLLSRSENGYFETNKPALPQKGDVLWCFEGEGRPKHFRLVARGIVTRTARRANLPSRVHFRASVPIEPADVNKLPWFPRLFRSQGSFGFGLNAIKDPEIVEELEQYAASLPAAERGQFTDLCAYTIKHSSSFDKYSDGGNHTIGTKGKSWARIVEVLAERKDGEIVPVLFAPAERFIRVTACADLVSVTTQKNDGANSFTFTNFRRLSPPLLKASLKWHDGHPLGDFQRDYAICQTPKDLADRLVLSPGNEEEHVAALEKDRSISETTRKALIDARRGQGAFRKDLDKRWNDACAVTNCSIRDVLRASHIKPWKKSSNDERLDPENGLLLLANIDILFEKGFVSFDDDGRMLISAELSAKDRRLLGLPKNLRRKPDLGEKAYLVHHRRTFKL